jgi:DNA-binding PadR family transcriptional regulator
MRGESIKGHLDLLLLSILASSDAHGYAVIEGLKAQSDGAFDLPEGTVYPALHRLERLGLIASAWDTSGPRRRRVYSVTRRGRKALVTQREEFKEFTRAMTAVVGP